MAVNLKMAPRAGERKHDCPDCRVCGFCSATRCNACRSGKCNRTRLSFAEQIDLFDRLNRDDPVRPDLPLKITI